MEGRRRLGGMAALWPTADAGYEIRVIVHVQGGMVFIPSANQGVDVSSVVVDSWALQL
jgi:hypothetical protein